MRWKTILYLCGSVLLYLAFSMLVPLILAMWERDAIRLAFSLSVVLTMVCAWIFLFYGAAPGELSIRESFACVTLIWFLAAVFSALPFYISGAAVSFTDAFFEAVSGLTTTGATVLEDVEILPRALLLWRSLLHWLGGMGIVVLFVAVFPRLGITAGNLMQAESPGPITNTVTAQIAQTAKILWLLYVALTAALTMILNMLGLSVFDAVTHAFATMATGGFSTKNASIAAFANPAVEWVIILFMLLAGGNFILYYYLLGGRLKTALVDKEAHLYLLMVICSSLLVSLSLLSHYNPQEAIRFSCFQVVSMITTTGFVTADFALWPAFSRAILLLLMFTGGCGGSTGGGIKQIRLLITVKMIFRELKNAGSPLETRQIRIGDMTMHSTMVNRVTAFVLLYLAILVISVLYLSSLGYDLVTSLSAAASAQGNIGPGLGMLGPSKTYYPLLNGAKTWLAFLMIIGRLEIYTVFAFILPYGRKARYTK